MENRKFANVTEWELRIESANSCTLISIFIDFDSLYNFIGKTHSTSCCNAKRMERLGFMFEKTIRSRKPSQRNCTFRHNKINGNNEFFNMYRYLQCHSDTPSFI